MTATIATAKPRISEAPDPRRGQFLTIALITAAVLGILVAAELTHIHYKVNTDPDFKSFCNMGEAVNCETVAASAYSEFLGVPIAVWGLFAYIMLLGLALAGVRRGPGGHSRGLPGLVFLWSLAGLAATGVMGYISVALIESKCILCMSLYVLNAIILALGLLMTRRLGGGVAASLGDDLGRARRVPVRSASILLALAAMTLGLIFGYPSYGLPAVDDLPLPEIPTAAKADQHCGAGYHTAEGFPALGNLAARVTIEEFSDYECPFCSRAHGVVRQIVAEYGERVRFVHRHFPLDQACNSQLKRPFHQHACLAARAAICGDAQRRFWELNDILWANAKHLERKHLVGYAREMGLDVLKFEACLVDPETDVHLQRDIRDGVGWKVRGTPSFVINGKFVEGAVPPERFRELIDEALALCDEPTPAPGASDPGAPVTAP